MHYKIWLALFAIVSTSAVVAQTKKQFSIANQEACDNVQLIIKANSGNCYIKPSHSADILNVFSNQPESSFSHNFNKNIVGKTCRLALTLEELRTEGLSKSISSNIFKASATRSANDDTFWKMYLTENKPYSLELTYGVGQAYIDLSGLSIQKLKVSTASANVNVAYHSLLENQVEMDTFFVKVDLGSVVVEDLSLAKAHCVMADIGLGNMTLDFNKKPLVQNTVKGRVGAGNLTIKLPTDDTAVLIKISESWLCSIKMPTSLKKISNNTYANSNYTKSKKADLTFDLDVSMGSITFQ
jgi:hypothetical protein